MFFFQVESHPLLTQKPLLHFCNLYNISLTAYSALGQGNLLKDPKIVAIAKKYHKSTAQVLLRYQVQRGIPVVPKSTSKERIIQNLNVFDFKLAADDIQAIESLNRDKRFLEFAELKSHMYYPFSDPY